MDAWTPWVDGQLDDVRRAGRWREPRPFDARGPEGTLADGSAVVSFASNDYLGLSCHPSVLAAARDAVDRWGTGATASRYVVGSRPVHDMLEHALAEWKATERAALFPSGYAANLGVLSTLTGPGTLVVSDERNHASIIDGCRLGRGRVAVARHADVAHVDELLRQAGHDRALVVTDTVFSMDGDVAPVDELRECCRRHGALLVLDDAHAVLGPDACAGTDDALVLRVVTLSKALGSMGGAVCGPAALIDLIVNRARSAIFTTALSPPDTAAAMAALGVLRSGEGRCLVDRLRALTDRVLAGHPSPIVPVVVGAEGDAVAASDALLARGLLVPAIRPPTVEPGTSRLRIALSAAHTDAMVDDLLAALDDIGLRP